MWNPDAVLRVEDIHHHPNTQERLDKAAATQMVFEDALIHIIDCLIQKTGSDRLVPPEGRP
jgi:carbamoyltransferase